MRKSFPCHDVVLDWGVARARMHFLKRMARIYNKTECKTMVHYTTFVTQQYIYLFENNESMA